MRYRKNLIRMACALVKCHEHIFDPFTDQQILDLINNRRRASFELNGILCIVTQVSSFNGDLHYGFCWDDARGTHAGWIPVDFIQPE